MKRQMLLLPLLLILLLWSAGQVTFCQANFWQQTNGPYGGDVYSLVSDSVGHLFAGTWCGGIFRSTDKGGTWVSASTGIGSDWVRCLAVHPNGFLLAGLGGGGIFRSSDDGESWLAIKTDQALKIIQALLVKSDGLIFVGTAFGGVFRSENNGGDWTQVNQGLANLCVASFTVDSLGHLFAGTFDGIFRSENNGATWIPVSDGLNDRQVVSLMATKTSLLAGTNGGRLYRSTNCGDAWTEVQVSPTGLSSVYALAFDGVSTMVLGTWYSGIFLSTDDGCAWRTLNSGLEIRGSFFARVTALAFSPARDLYAGTTSGVYRFYGMKVLWLPMSNRLLASDIIVVGTSSLGSLFAASETKLFRSKNGGEDWECVFISNWYITSLASSPSGCIFLGVDGGDGILRSTDNGDTWHSLRSKMPLPLGVRHLAVDCWGHVFAATGSGVLASSDDGEHWRFLNDGLMDKSVKSLAASPSGELFAGCATGIYRSTNEGDTWNRAGAQSGSVARVVAAPLGHAYAIINYELFHSSDSGQSWANPNVGSSSGEVFAIGANSLGHILISTRRRGVLRSTDDGGTWTDANAGLSGIAMCFSFGPDGYWLTGTRSCGVFRWVESAALNHSPCAFRLLSPVALHLVQLTYPSKPLCFIWQESRDPDSRDSIRYTLKLFGDGFDTTITRIKDTVVSLSIMPRFKCARVYEWFVRSTDGLLDALSDTGRFQASSSLVSVDDGIDQQPKEYGISQNYPNPFNPTTAIQYSVPSTQYVSLKIYDVLGREIALLVDEMKQPGTYIATWDASGFSSGVYFYRLKAEGFVETKRMILLR